MKSVAIISGTPSLCAALTVSRSASSGTLIRIWVDKYEAAAFDEDAEAASTIHEYEARIAALERLVGKQAPELEFLKGAAARTTAEKRAHVRHHRHKGLSITEGCRLMGIARSAYYTEAKGSADDTAQGHQVMPGQTLARIVAVEVEEKGPDRFHAEARQLAKRLGELRVGLLAEHDGAIVVGTGTKIAGQHLGAGILDPARPGMGPEHRVFLSLLRNLAGPEGSSARFRPDACAIRGGVCRAPLAIIEAVNARLDDELPALCHSAVSRRASHGCGHARRRRALVP